MKRSGDRQKIKSNLLKEIQQLLDKKSNGNNIPVPSYLFVQRYGREIQDDMKEISSLLGQKEWFLFSSASKKMNEKLLTGFQIVLETHSGIGKEYAGSILIELSGEEEEKELEELLDYVHSQEYRLHCIYTIKASENIKEIKGILENYGFVRVVKGEEYKVSEQVDIFREIIKKYQYQLDKVAENCMVDFLNKQKWQEEDDVKIRIQNMAKEIVYNKLMEQEQEDKVIRKEEVENAIRSFEWGKKTKRQMGFVMGGVEVE